MKAKILAILKKFWENVKREAVAVAKNPIDGLIWALIILIILTLIGINLGKIVNSIIYIGMLVGCIKIKINKTNSKSQNK